MIVKKENDSFNDLIERIDFLERHIKGQDARIALLENKINDNKKK
jgi:hypothetical protein